MPPLAGANLPTERTLEHLRTHMAAQPYSAARLRCIASLAEDGWSWRIASMIVHFFPEDSRPEPASSCHYPRVKLLERWYEVDQFDSLLEQVRADELAVDDTRLHHLRQQMSSYDLLPSENDYFKLAGYLYEVSGGGRDAPFHSEPLVAYGLPFHSSMIEAVRSWVELRGFHGPSDARLTRTLLFLPECRAGFDSFHVRGTSLCICVWRSLPVELRIKGEWRIGNEVHEIEEQIQNSRVQFDLEVPPDYLEIYLVGSDDEVYDWHQEAPGMYTRTHRRIFGSGVAMDADVERAALRGEGETIEFKPFIKPGDSKQNELIETATAFANARGGNIYLGISDQCQIVGIGRELMKDFGERAGGDLEQAARLYMGELRQLLRSRTRELQFEMRFVRNRGAALIIIHVPGGPRPPYLDQQGRRLLIRRGANNAPPDEEAHRRLIAGTRSGFGYID